MAKRYLIIGQGLAGSILARTFNSKDIPFQIIDDNHKSSSSVVAVGIMHPISFKRLILSWNAIEFIEKAKSYYREVENVHSISLLREMPIYRPIVSEDEKEFWLNRMAEDEYKGVLDYIEELDLKEVNIPCGAGIVKGGAQLNTNAFLEASKKELLDNHQLLNTTFEFDKLEVTENSINYLGEEFSDVIFCEGHRMMYNPFFSYLPHNFTQGEVLAVKSSDMPSKWISRGCFFLPAEENENVLRVGSTYKWNCTNDSPTKEGRDELLKRVMKLGDIKEPKVLEHQAGIRPTTHDRRPYMGTHPLHSNVHLFNGMGSKTVMLAPLLAEQFSEYFKDGVPLDPKVDIFRCRKQQLAKFGFYEAKKM